MKVLEVENINKNFGRFKAVNDVSFQHQRNCVCNEEWQKKWKKSYLPSSKI